MGGSDPLGKATQLPNEFQAFLITASAGSFLVEFIYFLLAAVAIKYALADRAAIWWRLPVVAAAIATPVLAYKGSLDPWPSYPNNRGIIFAIACVIIAAIWWLIVKLTRPDAIRDAAAHAEAHRDVPPLDETLDYRPGSGEPVVGPT